MGLIHTSCVFSLPYGTLSYDHVLADGSILLLVGIWVASSFGSPKYCLPRAFLCMCLVNPSVHCCQVVISVLRSGPAGSERHICSLLVVAAGSFSNVAAPFWAPSCSMGEFGLARRVLMSTWQFPSSRPATWLKVYSYDSRESQVRGNIWASGSQASLKTHSDGLWDGWKVQTIFFSPLVLGPC